MMAARNNADLYEAVFDAHGLRYVRDASAFRAVDPPPPFYSPMTLCAPVADADLTALRAWLHKTAGRVVGFKDSFRQLPRNTPGLTSLFDAKWVWRAPQPSATRWVRVRTPQMLIAWEEAWKAGGSATAQRMFPETLLDHPKFGFFASVAEGTINAGCITNLSPDCVGLSNVFAQTTDTDVFKRAAEAAGSLARHLPIVSYDRGDALRALLKADFQECGGLRVWVAA